MRTILLIAAVACTSLAVAAPKGATEPSKTPKFAWRGHMLDTCRHFFTVSEIKKTLDLMREHDLNVFHWHLTDGEGWRLAVDRYPKLTEVGSVRTASSKRTTTMGLDVVDGPYGPYFYSKDDVREIVRYAAERGIAVVPEIEIPGHESAAIRAYPELGCTGRWNCGEFCLGKEYTFEFMQNVLDEVMELFPGKVIHIGGDECRAHNWKVCTNCQERIRSLGLKDEHALQGWATKRFAEYLEKKGRRLMGWDELASWDDLPRSVIVQSYRGASYGVAAAKKGFDVVMSPDVYCYLDYVQGLKDDPEEYQPFGVLLDVGKIARFDPCEGVPESCRKHILGGEGNLWTELVPDWKGVEWRVWPRLAALADVLKNGPAENVPAFLAKMSAIRDDLVKRGVNAAPLGPLFKPRPDLLPGARYESFKADNGERMDFAKMLANPLDMSVLQFDLQDKTDRYRRVFATCDASLPAGSYRLDLNWDGIAMSASDDDGFRLGLEQMKALARVKRGGTLEFSGAVIVGGPAGVAADAAAGLSAMMDEGVFAKAAVERRVRELLAEDGVSAARADAWFRVLGDYCRWPHATPLLRRKAIDRMVEVAQELGTDGKDTVGVLYRLRSLEYLTGDGAWGKLYAAAKAARPALAGEDARRLEALLFNIENGPRGRVSQAIAGGYAGKTAVLTGAASGMGRCCAETLAEAGATVFVCDIDAAGAKRVADAINARGAGKAYAVTCDVRTYADAEKAAALAVKETGRIDLMVHWAGGYEPRMRNTNGVPFYEQPLEVLDWGIDVNLKGAIYFARACMPQMVKQGSGVLVCIGSVTGFEGDGCGAMYGTAKSGLFNFVKGLAKAGAPHGIRAFSVTPGPVMTRPGMAKMKTVLDRPSQPQELVDFVLYLASESCPSVTGTNHVMDAGRLCLP